MADLNQETTIEDDFFPKQVSGLPEAHVTAAVSLADGDVLPLRIGPIRKTIAGTPLRMLAYNGSIPGPLLRVQQGTTVTVEVANDAGLEQTVHWHGLRLDNRSDGVPYETQQPIRPASSSAANCGSPTPACTGTTHTSERTTPRRWACTARSSSIRPAPTTGLRSTRASR